MKIIRFLFLYLISVNLYSTQEILTLGFGSCLHQDRSMAILKTIEKKELDLFMFIGDNVYGDQKDGELDKLIRTYKQQYNNLENFLKNVSTEFIWDDHDFGLNDGGSNYRYKDRAKELFLETWKIPSQDSRRLRDGLYFDKMIKKNDRILNRFRTDFCSILASNMVGFYTATIFGFHVSYEQSFSPIKKDLS